MLIFKKIFRTITAVLITALMSVALLPQASAHIMVAQHGTLNLKNKGVYMVLSLPVSAFTGLDENHDGAMSADEFIKHKADIISQVHAQIKLVDKNGKRPLQGILLTPVLDHEPHAKLSKQLVVMGRFSLDKSKPEASNNLRFQLNLFGQNTNEQSYTISARRTSIANQKSERYTFTLTPEDSDNKLFNAL